MSYFFNHPTVWLTSIALFLIVMRGILLYFVVEPKEWMSTTERIEVEQKYGSLAKKVKYLRELLQSFEVCISIGLVIYFSILILTLENYEKIHAWYSICYVAVYVFINERIKYLKQKKINARLALIGAFRRDLMCNSLFAAHVNEQLDILIHEHNEYLKAEEIIRKYLENS